MRRWRLAFLALFSTGLVSSASASVTYTVHVPPGTKGCFIAGEMNGWIPHEMKRRNATTYVLTLKDAKTSGQYKYCSGPTWEYVERDVAGNDLANRNYHASDTVVRWAKIWDPAENALPAVSSGTIQRIFFKSKYVDARNVDVWLPEGYDNTKKYSVLYMQDGQNLFDAGKTWNKQSWQTANAVGRLMQEDSIRTVIVVGIWNDGNRRIAEYFPQKAFDDIPAPYKDSLLAWMPGGPVGDRYLKFIVSELKPFIDSTFSVYTDPENTFIMGSSYGGLISFYALCEYPEVFSGAACLSTHWIGLFYPNNAIPNAIDNYLAHHLPSPDSHRIYFDYGSRGFDQFYAPYQLKADALLKQKGYSTANWETRSFPGMDHSEKSWAARLTVPLFFLLGK